jgi:hypothetical protein
MMRSAETSTGQDNAKTRESDERGRIGNERPSMSYILGEDCGQAALLRRRSRTNEPGMAVLKGASQSLRQARSSIPYSGVQTKEACNKDDNYHYAVDRENVHGVLRSRYVPISI